MEPRLITIVAPSVIKFVRRCRVKSKPQLSRWCSIVALFRALPLIGFPITRRKSNYSGISTIAVQRIKYLERVMVNNHNNLLPFVVLSNARMHEC